MQGYARTAMLMALLTALFMGVGWLLGGSGGALVALVVAAGMNIATWWNSDRLVLSMQGARPATGPEARGLAQMLRDLSRNANMPVPALYIIDTD